MADPYKVIGLSMVTQTLQAWKSKYPRSTFDSIMASFTTIAKNLARDPISWGEALNNIKPGGVLCVSCLNPVAVTYACFEAHKAVIIKKVQLTKTDL